MLIKKSLDLCCVSSSRLFSTSSIQCGFLKKLKNQVVWEEDWKKRPSDLEVRKKNLPYNTPTLEQRIARDTLHKFHTPDRHAGYHLGPTGTVFDHFEEDLTLKQLIIDGYHGLKDECKLLAKEIVTMEDVKVFNRPGDTEFLFNFTEDGAETDQLRDQFVVTADSSWGEGYSWASLEASPSNNSAYFLGELSTSVPQDGRMKRAGYVSLKSVTKRKSFGRLKTLDFEFYDAIRLRIRGDGRAYVVNVHVHYEIDLQWMDLYQFPLYTRGGPYWQEVIIPYSKFIFTHRGAIQDKQQAFDPQFVSNIGIALMDQINGPFHLEIAEIELMKHEGAIEMLEDHAYETYRMPHGLYLGQEM